MVGLDSRADQGKCTIAVRPPDSSWLLDALSAGKLRSVTSGGDFERCIATLSCQLFDGIDGQSSGDDRRSWLALQRAVRDSKGAYVYLEIGSYLGGSLQQYLLDPKCSSVFSIDKRPADSPDARGETLHYRDNSVEKMLDGLRAVAPDQMHKLVCFDSDARDVNPALIVSAPDLCFIDGEHTAGAVVSDFLFCLRVCAPDAVVYFHDESLVRPAIRECLRHLKRRRASCAAYKLPGDTIAIALDNSPVNADHRIRQMASDGKRWIAGIDVSNRARLWVPPVIRPALGRLRDAWLRSHRPR